MKDPRVALKHWLYPESRIDGYDQAKKHAHDDLVSFESRLQAYAELSISERRVVRAILAARIGLYSPGKADVVRGVAAAAFTTTVVLIVSFWSDWTTAWIEIQLVPWMNDHRDQIDPVTTMGDVFAPMIQLLVVAVLAIASVVYFWGGFVRGVDRKRAISQVWLSAYEEQEASRPKSSPRETLWERLIAPTRARSLRKGGNPRK